MWDGSGIRFKSGRNGPCVLGEMRWQNSTYVGGPQIPLALDAELDSYSG